MSLPRSIDEIAGARLVVVGGDAARTVAIGSMGITIGTDVTCGLCLADPHVSSEHVRVTLTADGVRVEDMDSRNGTVVNGMASERVVLTSSSVIRIGETDIRLELGSAGPEHAHFDGVVGESDVMHDVFDLLAKLASTELGVMLLGETGTGKDVLARAMHEASDRAAAPFAVFDCGAVAANLIESDLFGHHMGAFTGAVSDRAGVFERGHGGTVFLDEVGELPLDLQPRLLRVLEQRQVLRVGGHDPVAVDVRVIAATNRDLEAEVAAGRFRSDLFFRLSAAVVRVPPLRDRTGDVPRLVASFLRDMGRRLTSTPETLRALETYDWPGNVRELKNVIASAAAFAEGSLLEPRHLLFFKRRRRRANTLHDLPLGGRTLEALESVAIRQTLLQTGGNKAKTARVLGIAPSTLYAKLKKLGITDQ